MAVLSPEADIMAVRRRLRDEAAKSRLEDANVDEAIQAAVAEYSRDRPADAVADITGAGSPYIELSTSSFAGWTTDFSRVLRIEYPAYAVSTAHTPQFLDPASDWEIYRDTTKYYIRLIGATPSASEKVRVWYTKPRALLAGSPTDTDTIVTTDKKAVLNLAASYACEVLASKASGFIDPTVPSDAVNYRDQQAKWRSEADAWRKLYNAHMGRGQESDVRAATVLRDWDYEGAFRGAAGYLPLQAKTGRRPLTHRGRR